MQRWVSTKCSTSKLIFIFIFICRTLSSRGLFLPWAQFAPFVRLYFPGQASPTRLAGAAWSNLVLISDVFSPVLSLCCVCGLQVSLSTMVSTRSRLYATWGLWLRSVWVPSTQTCACWTRTGSTRTPPSSTTRQVKKKINIKKKASVLKTCRSHPGQQHFEYGYWSVQQVGVWYCKLQIDTYCNLQ